MLASCVTKHNSNWAIPEKVQTVGVEDTEFLGVLKKKYVEIPGGQLKKKWNFQGCPRKTHMVWNFHGSWF